MKAGDASEVPATDYLLSAAPLMPRLAGYMQRQLDAERGVIAKELHDELGGFLVAAKMDVSHALRQLPHAPARFGSGSPRCSTPSMRPSRSNAGWSSACSPVY